MCNLLSLSSYMNAYFSKFVSWISVALDIVLYECIFFQICLLNSCSIKTWVRGTQLFYSIIDHRTQSLGSVSLAILARYQAYYPLATKWVSLESTFPCFMAKPLTLGCIFNVYMLDIFLGTLHLSAPWFRERQYRYLIWFRIW